MAPMKFSPPAGRRGGFTLVELLVAAGLSILVMAILATAFQQGMETLSHLKSTVTLSQQLRGVETVIRDDLRAAHLEDGSTGATVRVSDAKRIGAGWLSPDKGYFRLAMQTELGGTDPGFVLEQSGVSEPNSYRATNHSMRFTVRLSGDTPQDLFTAFVPLGPASPPSPPPSRLPALMDQSEKGMVKATDANTLFAGVWAEVTYYLDPSAGAETTNADGSPGLQLYTLRRRVRVLAPDALDQTVDVPADFPEVSYRSQTTPTAVDKVNTPATVTIPMNRPPMAALTGTSLGSDALLSNVVSMQILPMLDPVPTGTGVAPAGATATTYLEYPGDTSSANPRWEFDTASPTVVSSTGTPPVVVHRSLKAVQLKLRVYDVRNRATRQVTIAQDL